MRLIIVYSGADGNRLLSMEPDDFMKRGYLLPEGCKDLSDVWKRPNKGTWRDRLPECFGVVDLEFCSHPLEAASAIEMIYEARHSGASSGEIISAIHDYLVSRGASQEHINAQIKVVTELVA